ncbi:MAG: ABC transporter permease [Trueperaceae bacterium]|nr:ABC transporter permease [Trueperaceae bacterium]
MSAYIIRRLLGLIPVLFGISLLVFIIPRAVRGDPATIILGERAEPATLERLREQLGLNRPLFFNQEGFQEKGIAGLFDSQYFQFLSKALRGDLGRSIFRLTQVRDELAQRFPATFELSIVAMFFAFIIGVPAGVIAALNRGKLLDTGIMFAALAGVSFPVFWLAIILIYAFSVNLGWLPPSGRIDISFEINPITRLYVLDGLLRGDVRFTLNAIKHLVLPSIALGTIPLAIIVRMTRSSMLEVLGQDYVRTARAKGLKQRLVINKHALRNALLPVITVIGLSFGGLLSGAILTETVFAWPGIGKWVYDAIAARDYPIIQGGVLFVAFIFVIVNLLVDLSYALIDPRIQYS